MPLAVAGLLASACAGFVTFLDGVKTAIDMLPDPLKLIFFWTITLIGYLGSTKEYIASLSENVAITSVFEAIAYMINFFTTIIPSWFISTILSAGSGTIINVAITPFEVFIFTSIVMFAMALKWASNG